MRFHFAKWRHGYRRWFAWFPVPLWPYEGKWVWLEWIECEPDPVTGGLTGYQYRELKAVSDFKPPDDSVGWVHESGPGITPHWRKLGDVHGKGVTVPTMAQDGYSNSTPLKEGYVRKGGSNSAKSQIQTRPAAPAPMKPTSSQGAP